MLHPRVALVACLLTVSIASGSSAQQASSAAPTNQPQSSVQPPEREPLTPELIRLRNRLRGVLAHYQRRHLNTRDNDNWEAMHAFIAYGVDTQLRVGHPRGNQVNAIAWILNSRPMAGERMLYVNNGRLHARQGPKVQGHHGQLLALLAQVRVDRNYKFQVEGQDFTVMDLVETEQLTCVPNSEQTFKLIGLMYYLPSDTTWTSQTGERWDFPRLIREEIAQPIRIVKVTCGGTHQLMGLSRAVELRRKRGEPVDGDYLRAAQMVREYQQHAFNWQNRDGSFSTEWFRGPGNRDDLNRKIQTTGHIGEWMAASLPEQYLRHPRMIMAMNFLVDSLSRNTRHDWEIGPLGHAVHALAIYDERVFREPKIERPEPPSQEEKEPAPGDNHLADEKPADEKDTKATEPAVAVPAVAAETQPVNEAAEPIAEGKSDETESRATMASRGPKLINANGLRK